METKIPSPICCCRYLCCLLLLWLTACAGPAEQQKGAAPVKQICLLMDEAGLKEAEQALQQQCARSGNALFVCGDVHFYSDNRIVLELIDTTLPTQVNHFEYRDGKWQSTGLLQVDLDRPYAKHITPLQDVLFEKIPAICRHWKTKAGGFGDTVAIPGHICFSLWVADQDRSWYTAPLDSAGVQFRLVFNKDGSFREYREI